MNPDLAALAVHDLKNALGHLEAELVRLELNPQAQAARTARQHCVQLRQRFVHFLVLYGVESELKPHAQDESPLGLLAQLAEQSAYYGAQVPTAVVQQDLAPPFWFFDLRLVRLAMDAALDNAWRFAQSGVELSARVTDGYLVLTVDDDGPGLQNPQLHLGAVSDWSTGLGCQLGAAVARAHEHAGRFGRAELKNRPQGGARFELWLP
ncbi:MAG: sensor histidine kinase [Betaproteobacteria bacterium]|nr:sensor histidine kinase [Betaproteobacteria bacterium]NBY71944.1 sensor histidine kinase [Betaproteobacteria bacterium]